MALSEKKKRDIYNYYSENGFHHSTDAIVEKLEICHKTFFNRYGTKANSIEIAWNYWQNLCAEKWTSIMKNCNHSVEELTMIVYNFYKIRFENPFYYEYTRDQRKYLDPDSFFFTALQSVLEKGKKCFHIQENLNLKAYITFLLNNMFLIDTEHYNKPEVFRFILHPALTERGMELFMETPFA
jgi:hypothetical protein